MTLPELQRHLWGAADLLRGSFDAADFKRYIFGLLLYKRLCDVWVEESAARLPHRVEIPEGCAWLDVYRRASGLGAALDAALRTIERANPRLEYVFRGVDFADPERFPDQLVRALLEHFARLHLGRSEISTDMIGGAHDYLLAHFAEATTKRLGEFYTPRSIARLMVELLRPHEGETVYDPACGSGVLLLEVVLFIERQSGDRGALSLYGQEKNLEALTICKTSLLLQDIEDAHIAPGDTLLEPGHITDDGKLRRFDVILANPPVGLRGWGRERWVHDRYGRARFGNPPSSHADYAFIEHMLGSLHAHGRMAVVCPHGVLFRGGAEAHIRAKLLEADLVEAVIGLAEDLFFATSASSVIIVFRHDKPASRRGRVLFVNGEQERTASNGRYELSLSNIEGLSSAYHEFIDRASFCRVVSLDEIRASGHNLAIPRYVRSTPSREPIDVGRELAALGKASADRKAAERRFIRDLEELGYVG